MPSHLDLLITKGLPEDIAKYILSDFLCTKEDCKQKYDKVVEQLNKKFEYWRIREWKAENLLDKVNHYQWRSYYQGISGTQEMLYDRFRYELSLFHEMKIKPREYIKTHRNSFESNYKGFYKFRHNKLVSLASAKEYYDYDWPTATYYNHLVEWDTPYNHLFISAF